MARRRIDPRDQVLAELRAEVRAVRRIVEWLAGQQTKIVDLVEQHGDTTLRHAVGELLAQQLRQMNTMLGRAEGESLH